MSQINVNKVISPTLAANPQPAIDFNSNGNVSVNADTIFVDSTNDRLGIGTASPGRTLDIQQFGGISFNAGLIFEDCQITGSGLSGTSHHSVEADNSRYWNGAASGNWTYNIRFNSSGLEVDIVPVVPINNPEKYVWQPQRGGGGKYITSVENHLDFSLSLRKTNSSYTSIVRALKWWRNYKELKPNGNEGGISSYAIELVVAYLDINQGVEENIEEAIIRYFQFLSESTFPEINFAHAINNIPYYNTAVYIADDTNNENNAAKKISSSKWNEIKEEAEVAFDTLNLAQERNNEGDTINEWKSVFGPTFNIK